jgi:endonuclease IV
MVSDTKIGFSTGCLYKTSIDVFRSVDFFRGIGADAIELSLADDPSLDNFINQFNEHKGFKQRLEKYRFISIHAPFKDVIYQNDSYTQDRLSKLNLMVDLVGAKSIVIHPDNVTDFGLLKKSKLPIALENMDLRKKCGIDLGFFESIFKDSDFAFVLDLNHAYEHDPSMKLASDFLSTMKKRLSHFHLSGRDLKIGGHYPVYNSHNKEILLKMIKNRDTKEYPIILEGMFNGEKEIALNELNYVRKILE